MLHAGVKRVVAVSVAFLFKDSIIPPAYLAGRLFLPDLVADASEMEQVFANSGLDWTSVRPPRLTDKPRKRAYRVREDHLPRFGFTISRADVADFVLKCAENHVSSRKIVGVRVDIEIGLNVNSAAPHVPICAGDLLVWISRVG